MSGIDKLITFWRLFQEKYSLTSEEFNKIAVQYNNDRDALPLQRLKRI